MSETIATDRRAAGASLRDASPKAANRRSVRRVASRVGAPAHPEDALAPTPDGEAGGGGAGRSRVTSTMAERGRHGDAAWAMLGDVVVAAAATPGAHAARNGAVDASAGSPGKDGAHGRL
jgi:hypothetical protein